VAANLAVLAPLSALLGVVLAGWAELRKTAPFDGTYEWLNIATAFSGPTRFQNFVTDLGIRVSHLTTVLMLAAIGISLAVLVWSRAGARGEPSPARYYGLQALLLGSALGVVVATDLGQIYVFWGAAAVATYLLLSNSWADEAATRGGRLALAVPALTDLALLAGVALLYSRFGQTNIDSLITQIPQVGIQLKTQVIASILIFAGAAGRLGLFPFQGWLTGAADTSPGAQASVQGLWTVMVAALLYKVLPLFVSAPGNATATRTMAAAAAVSAVLLPLLALSALDARRAVTAAGIGVSAVALISFAVGNVAPAAVLLAATGLARAGAVLAVGALVNGMRTPLVVLLGEGWRRMRLSVLALPLAVIGLGLGAGPVAGGGLRWYWTAAYALGLGLGTLAVLRVYLVAAHGSLPRRRGFDPNRVRPAPPLLAYPALALGLGAALLSALLFSDAFVFYVDHLHRALLDGTVAASWIGVVVLGAILAVIFFFTARDLGGRLTAAAGERLAGAYLAFRSELDRMLVEPGLDLVERAEEGIVGEGEDRLGAAVTESAWILHRPSFGVVLPVLGGIAVVLALVAALLAPGVYR
jgi:NADH:ubiquinone oxidoreductase subunit 5 (subunit L)/multisubunit Na+/H+ antiporter MnhA subunit